MNPLGSKSSMINLDLGGNNPISRKTCVKKSGEEISLVIDLMKQHKDPKGQYCWSKITPLVNQWLRNRGEEGNRTKRSYEHLASKIKKESTEKEKETQSKRSKKEISKGELCLSYSKKITPVINTDQENETSSKKVDLVYETENDKENEIAPTINNGQENKISFTFNCGKENPIKKPDSDVNHPNVYYRFSTERNPPGARVKQPIWTEWDGRFFEDDVNWKKRTDGVWQKKSDGSFWRTLDNEGHLEKIEGALSFKDIK